ncbi:MAG: hypothetical protein QOI64_1849, partial [Solirubrobacteraceae bacterium]|nr:hypothetical protein [Solirubrobacteraceae bacterium]
MTPTMQLYWDASSAMIVRDWKTFISYRSQLIGQFVAVFSSLTLFYYVSRLVSLG